MGDQAVEVDCTACGTRVYVWAQGGEPAEAVGDDGSRSATADAEGHFVCPECGTSHPVPGAGTTDSS